MKRLSSITPTQTDASRDADLGNIHCQEEIAGSLRRINNPEHRNCLAGSEVTGDRHGGQADLY